MPAKGKHRRPKTPRFSRSIAVAGTGGAALALPLLGATGAHAATPAQSVPGKAVRTLPETVHKTAAQSDSGVRSYTVRSGDCLATIAEAQHVDGGWQRLYDDNRQAVGADPSLIHPGLKLTLGGKAAAAHAESAAPRHTPAAPKPSRPAAASRSAHASAPSSAPSSAQTSRPAGEGTAQTASTGYTLPVAGATIGTGYHVAGSMWSSGYHTGVDFVVPTGTPLKAVAAGTVVSAGWGGAYGNQVVIKLDDGHYAQYAHLSQLSVSAGQTVTAGQQVGLSGATGNVTGPHLHFEIRTTPDYGSDLDPVGYLRGHGVAVG
ncbi:LysM peptidoglycan-binding domain-containing M23 family metallopeptidase [Streptomyces sp. SP2-10]|uniref:M23 family metallopeptidase n=1 Tax=Streptomyces sp. SP2-10 TaxID=2873385 RepID=UPI001CA68F7C|nr:LysM peptidoglycan-binding domain-containing M23 family metallopeptidase [Streptomyces sp. SP2-10]MBY8840823.1 LysM peptidoglycan-binding domain-containing M23 family metallopeptidase [Streptomyces sp. SP2-10]